MTIPDLARGCSAPQVRESVWTVAQNVARDCSGAVSPAGSRERKIDISCTWIAARGLRGSGDNRRVHLRRQASTPPLAVANVGQSRKRRTASSLSVATDGGFVTGRAIAAILPRPTLCPGFRQRKSANIQNARFRRSRSRCAKIPGVLLGSRESGKAACCMHKSMDKPQFCSCSQWNPQ